MIEDFSFLAGTATLFIKKCPTPLTAGLYAIEAISWFNSKASQLELLAYEKAMNEGTGVLIIRWSVGGTRCVGNSYSKYYSWNGEGDPFA